MPPLRIILVDDEKRIRTSLRHLIGMYYPTAEIVSEAGDMDSAYAEIRRLEPDVVLLDIQMPGGTGFDLVKKLSPINFKLIFVSAFDKYAIQAFKFSAIDYLLKPVDPEELVKALQKASALINESELALKIETLMNNMNAGSHDSKRILLKTHDAVHLISLSDIVRCEADRNYTRFIINNSNPILVSGSLIEYDETLSNSGFFRAHHSHLINLQYVTKIEKQNFQIIMKDNSVIPLATRKKDILLQLLEKSTRS
ncbi:MAG: response regulator transcription factor [Bacteroidia bacterium]|nr:response regulator transcription factor [Bacteroidia bacterium]